jgi:hypothetical protein
LVTMSLYLVALHLMGSGCGLTAGCTQLGGASGEVF